MKKNTAKTMWVVMVIIFILLVGLGIFSAVIKASKISTYYSYPRTKAHVLEVQNYQKRREGQDIEYGSTIHVEYTVLGDKVDKWLNYNVDSTLKAGDIITIAYNPDNTTDCYEIKNLDITRVSALAAALIFIAWICKRTFISRKEKVLE